MTTRRYPDIRDAVRDLCAQYLDAYCRASDAERAYPDAFFAAPPNAGCPARTFPPQFARPGHWLARAPATRHARARSGRLQALDAQGAGPGSGWCRSVSRSVDR